LALFGFGDKGPPIGFGPRFSARRPTSTDTAALGRVFERLQELTLSPRESARLIRQIDKEH
jgi:hypothetical protein